MSRRQFNKRSRAAEIVILFGLLCGCCYGTVYIAQPYAVSFEHAVPLRCGPDQYLDNCASPCPLTCENLNNPPYCPDLCVKGCTCINKGHVIDGNSGRCIPPKQCPVSRHCPINQTYYTANFNGATCDGVYIEYEKPGCYCDNLLVLNRLNGKCVLPSDCPKHPNDQVCPINEYVSSCKNPCAATCKEPTERVCPTFHCLYGCVCMQGLVRDVSTGKCMEQKFCPGVHIPQPISCSENEIFKQCGPQCQPTCRWPQVTCSLPCVKGCFCKPGFIRAYEDGECVPEWLCSYIRQEIV